ncbi:hypothetical protein PR048_005461 [Dryococelus australis]|uniref:Uncharacterized protein n=1 Tax=Dryococelus australis TaxID=614101 RepID=A0ABQ9I8B4_9NEOP|nr:hypothetical protein PR048_005461 [Dryococelus australis]
MITGWFPLKNWKHSLQYFMREEHMVPIPFMFFNCSLMNGVHFFFTKSLSRNNRFTEIMRFPCFDVKFTCSSRKQDDKFCIESEIWKKSVNNCCRCQLRQYLPNKPDKFGVKYLLDQLYGPDILPKKVTKNVLFQSTLHTGVDIDQQTEMKMPETVNF